MARLQCSSESVNLRSLVVCLYILHLYAVVNLLNIGCPRQRYCYPCTMHCGEDKLKHCCGSVCLSISLFVRASSLNLVNTIETDPLCASSSNLADMLTMTRGCNLLILETRCQRSRLK